MEWVSPKYRTLSALLMGLDGTVGTWILVGFAYGVKEWRMLILAVNSPLILSVIAWWYLTFTFDSFRVTNSWILLQTLKLRLKLATYILSCARWLPESARWLLANGKGDEACQYIMKCAKMNNREKKVENLTSEVYFKNAYIFGPRALDHEMLSFQ